MLDSFSHFTPQPVLDAFRGHRPDLPALAAFARLPQLVDVDARLESMQGFPDLQQVLNMGNPPVEVFGDPAVATDLARQINETLAGICRRHPERFPAFTAVLPMSDVGLAVAEIDHAVSVLGARGVQLYTNVLGQPLSALQFRPVFERMAALDLPVLVHPFRGADFADYPVEQASRDEIWFTFGWPYETTAFATRMVYSGIFSELPQLKIVLHHMGAMIPMFAGRIALGFEQIFTPSGSANPIAERAGLRGNVVDHFRHFYADTAVNGVAAAVRCGHEFFGTDHCLFGNRRAVQPGRRGQLRQ